MLDKFFYELNLEDGDYKICEDISCKEYDSITHFYVSSERDAKDAVSLLNGIYKEAERK
jgi:hypothetical protein